jgi:hypothetical protein
VAETCNRAIHLIKQILLCCWWLVKYHVKHTKQWDVYCENCNCVFRPVSNGWIKCMFRSYAGCLQRVRTVYLRAAVYASWGYRILLQTVHNGLGLSVWLTQQLEYRELNPHHHWVSCLPNPAPLNISVSRKHLSCYSVYGSLNVLLLNKTCTWKVCRLRDK